MLDVVALISSQERVASIGRWNITHLFVQREHRGGKLLVCFGGTKYGYIRSFYEYEDYHLLYLCDNLGPDGTPLWWMASEGDFSVRDAYVELIRNCIEQCGVAPEDVGFIGNCQGAFGALYLSYAIGAGCSLAIAPYFALGTAFRGSELLRNIVGESGVILDEHIFNHFNRHSDVRTHIIISVKDAMMRGTRVDRLLSIFLRNENIMTVKSLGVDHPVEVGNHVAICGVLSPDKILEELNQQMVLRYTTPF